MALLQIYKNTSILNGFDSGIHFTQNKAEADIALIGSRYIEIDGMPKLKGIFRAGIGKDNVPENEAFLRKILIGYPSRNTTNIIFDETASFTCSLIFRMLYSYVGDLDSWTKYPRENLSKKILLIIGTGHIGSRVSKLMIPFMNVITFDIIQNNILELNKMLAQADCVSIHIPNSIENKSFFNEEKLSCMKSGATLINTARGAIVDERALFKELKNGRLKAAFDVFWQEPYNGILKKLHPDKFYMTPHIASSCKGFINNCRKDFDKFLIQIKNIY